MRPPEAFSLNVDRVAGISTERPALLRSPGEYTAVPSSFQVRGTNAAPGLAGTRGPASAASVFVPG